MKKVIVITGVTGFVGINLKKYLSKYYVLKGLSRKSDEKNEIFEYINAKEVLSESEAIIHLAGKAHDLKKTANDAEYFEVNTELTKRIFDKFLESNCKMFIYLSSVKAVRDNVNTPLTEDHTPRPETAYGKSKLKAEEYIESQTLPEGKSCFILRPCMIHGTGNKGNLNLLYKFVAKKMPYPFAAFDNKRSFLSVDNICFIIKELIVRNDIPSGVYNVADDESLSTNELLEIISEVSNKKLRLIFIPKAIVTVIAKIGDRIRFPLNSENLKKLTENYIVSNRKIKKVLKIKKLPLSAREGLEKTIKSFNRNNNYGNT